MKRCKACSKWKPLLDFGKDTKMPDGLYYQCRDCANENTLKRRANKPERCMWSTTKYRAKKKGIPFNLTPEDIHIPEVCPILGMALRKGPPPNKKIQPNSPSLDRIDPTKGYTPDNIQVISQLANGMKQNATPDELLSFAQWVITTYR